jgi:hypothetical protein
MECAEMNKKTIELIVKKNFQNVILLQIYQMFKYQFSDLEAEIDWEADGYKKEL